MPQAEPAKEYDSNQVIISVDGQEIRRGRSQGTFFRVSPEAQEWGYKAAADGQPVFYRNNDHRSEIAIILDQTSDDNEILHAAYISGQSVDIQVVVLETGNFMFFRSCKVNRPSQEYGQETSDREWTILAGNHDTVHAGGVFA